MRAKFYVNGHTKPFQDNSVRLLQSLTAILVLATFAITPWHPALALEKKAAMAVDVNTGKTLYSKSGDELRYPASLTKIMTLYMVFELLQQGRLSTSTKIRISSQAAAQPPSRIGLKVGKTIRLRDAMKALVTKSANDIAVAIAEHIAGSESKFARLMTAKAKSIGMSKTVFKNASGLPNDAQVTTARDMLRLAIRIQEQFPKHYEIFKTTRFYYKGKTYKNHNKLLGRVKGVDGIKTGYIRKSGFNLVTSVKTGGKHIVAVVFGGKSAKKRNKEMKGLIAKLMPIASTRRTRPLLIARPRKATPPLRVVAPVRRPVRAQPRQVVATPIEVGRAELQGTNTKPRPQIAIANVHPLDINQLASRKSTPRQHAKQPSRTPGTLQDQLAMLLSKRSDKTDSVNQRLQFRHPATRLRPQTVNTGHNNPSAPNAPINTGPYQIQVGAYATHRDAEQRLSSVTRRSNGLLSGYFPLTQEVARGSRKIFRARFAGFDQASATQTCRELRRRAIDCLVAREP